MYLKYMYVQLGRDCKVLEVENCEFLGCFCMIRHARVRKGRII